MIDTVTRTFLLISSTETEEPKKGKKNVLTTLKEYLLYTISNVKIQVLSVEAPSYRDAVNCLDLYTVQTAYLLVEIFPNGNIEVVKNRFG